VQLGCSGRRYAHVPVEDLAEKRNNGAWSPGWPHQLAWLRANSAGEAHKRARRDHNNRPARP